eukprot:2008026-Prymnesium_polylepis.1
MASAAAAASAASAAARAPPYRRDRPASAADQRAAVAGLCTSADRSSELASSMLIWVLHVPDIVLDGRWPADGGARGRVADGRCCRQR